MGEDSLQFSVKLFAKYLMLLLLGGDVHLMHSRKIPALSFVYLVSLVEDAISLLGKSF